MREKIHIYLADDHQIIIDGLMLLFKDEPRFVVCGYSNNGIHAQEQILRLKPDVALIDLRMPGKDGLQVIQALKNKIETRFVILSMYSEKRYIQDAMQYGASGYLLKNAGKDELRSCILQVMEGNSYFTRSTEQKKEFAISGREVEILKYILNEMTTLQIAEKLSLSHFTVETHRKNIYKKTGAKNIAGLMRFALEHDIALNEV